MWTQRKMHVCTMLDAVTNIWNIRLPQGGRTRKECRKNKKFVNRWEANWPIFGLIIGVCI